MATKFRKPVVYVLSSFKDFVSTLANICPSVEFVGINKEDVSLESLREAEIIVADSDWISTWIFHLPKLKWVQSTFAGVDTYFKTIPPDLSCPSFVLTRNSSSFRLPMAEYVVGNIIAKERKFRLLWESQKVKNWVSPDELYYRCLSELTIGVVGFGEIGQEIAKYCKAMKMTINSVQRDATSPKLAFVDNVFSVENLSECLKQCDYVCSILPSTPETRGLFSGSVLESCKEKKTVFINIGRGDVVDEDSILKALANGWIGGAILDVFDVEPLPGSSPLWSHPEVTVTPHCSGLLDVKEISEVFRVNFEAYQSGKPMKCIVDWSKGY